MKKIISLILISLFCFSLLSCTSQSDTPTVNYQTSVVPYYNVETSVPTLPATTVPTIKETAILPETEKASETKRIESETKVIEAETNKIETTKEVNGLSYGQVKGLVTWKYNNFVGIRGDDGAKVMLIPQNANTKEYDNKTAAMFISGTYDSGIMVTKCDGYGNFDFGDRVPVGQYICLIVSKNTTSAARFSNEESWKSQITTAYGEYFSDADLETLMVFMGYNSLAKGTISVEKGRVNTISKDFGITYN